MASILGRVAVNQFAFVFAFFVVVVLFFVDNKNGAR